MKTLLYAFCFIFSICQLTSCFVSRAPQVIQVYHDAKSKKLVTSRPQSEYGFYRQYRGTKDSLLHIICNKCDCINAPSTIVVTAASGKQYAGQKLNFIYAQLPDKSWIQIGVFPPTVVKIERPSENTILIYHQDNRKEQYQAVGKNAVWKQVSVV
jgi:hypothetical protein